MKGHSIARVALVAVLACERAGLLYSASTGNLSDGVASGNGYGMVLQDESEVDYQNNMSFDGNIKQPVVGTGDLPVPSAPQPLQPPG